VRFKFKPEGVGTVIVSTTSGVVPTASTLSDSQPTMATKIIKNNQQ
jgi:hypothetical protein